MRDRAGQHPDIIIGNANRLGAVHDRQLRIIKPGDIQHHIGATRRKGGAGHGAVIADGRRMDNVAIMKNGRRYRHDGVIAELAAKLHRRPVRSNRQHRRPADKHCRVIKHGQAACG